MVKVGRGMFVGIFAVDGNKGSGSRSADSFCEADCFQSTGQTEVVKFAREIPVEGGITFFLCKSVDLTDKSLNIFQVGFPLFPDLRRNLFVSVHAEYILVDPSHIEEKSPAFHHDKVIFSVAADLGHPPIPVGFMFLCHGEGAVSGSSGDLAEFDEAGDAVAPGIEIGVVESVFVHELETLFSSFTDHFLVGSAPPGRPGDPMGELEVVGGCCLISQLERQHFQVQLRLADDFAAAVNGKRSVVIPRRSIGRNMDVKRKHPGRSLFGEESFVFLIDIA